MAERLRQTGQSEAVLIRDSRVQTSPGFRASALCFRRVEDQSTVWSSGFATVPDDSLTLLTGRSLGARTDQDKRHTWHSEGGQTGGSIAPQLDDVMMVRGADGCPQVIDDPSDTRSLLVPPGPATVCVSVRFHFLLLPSSRSWPYRASSLHCVFSLPAVTFDCNVRTGH